MRLPPHRKPTFLGHLEYILHLQAWSYGQGKSQSIVYRGHKQNTTIEQPVRSTAVLNHSRTF